MMKMTVGHILQRVSQEIISDQTRGNASTIKWCKDELTELDKNNPPSRESNNLPGLAEASMTAPDHQ